MDKKCAQVAEYHATPVFRIEPYVMLGTTVITSIIMLRFAFVGIKHVNLHRNSLVLLQNMTVSGLLARAGSAMVIVYQIIWLHRATSDPCNLLISYTECFFVRAPAVWGAVNIHTSVLTFFIERLFATIKSDQYERWSNKFVIATLISVQWSFGGMILIFYAVGQVGVGLQVSICHLSAISQIRYTIVGSALVLNDFASFVIVLILLFYNKKLKRKLTSSQCSLSTRYQIRENIRFLRIAGYVAFVIIAQVVIFSALRLIFRDKLLKWVYLNSEPLIQNVCCAANVILIEYKNRKQKKSIINIRPEVEDNIATLQNMWGDRVPSRKF